MEERGSEDSDALDVHAEMVMGSERRKGREVVFCMGVSVLYRGVERRNGPCEECAADEGGVDEI